MNPPFRSAAARHRLVPAASRRKTALRCIAAFRPHLPAAFHRTALLRNLFASLLILLAAGCRNRSAGESALPAAPQPRHAELLFAGDVMQHLPQIQAARRGDGFDYEAVFAAVRPYFEAADLAVVNLETTFAAAPPYRGYPCFRSPAALAGTLRRCGVDVVCQANNHVLDDGARGVRTTAAVLDSCRLLRTGVYLDSLDERRRHPLLIERGGIRFGLLNYTYGTNGLPTPQGMRVARIDTAAILRDLAGLAADSVDCSIVCLHWGNEYERQPNRGQRELARLLRCHGADLVIGSHPHVVQPVEADSTYAVFYSLGNFVSNQRRRWCDGGLMARIRVTKHPDGRMRYRAEAIPVWVALPGYRILPAPAADTMQLGEAYRRFRDDTEKLLGGRYRFAESSDE